MTPKQKASQLLIKVSESDRIEERSFIGLKTAKHICLFIVDEILNNEYNHMRGVSEDMHDEYWQEVRKEIVNL